MATAAAMITAASAMVTTPAAMRATTTPAAMAASAATSLGCGRRGEGAQANHGKDRHASRERPG